MRSPELSRCHDRMVDCKPCSSHESKGIVDTTSKFVIPIEQFKNTLNSLVTKKLDLELQQLADSNQIMEQA